MSDVITPHDNGHAFEELKKTIEAKGVQHLSETKEKLEKINDTMDEYEAKNQEFVSLMQVERKEKEELKERMIELEKVLARMPAGQMQEEKTKEMKKALDIFLRKDEKNKSNEEKALEQKYLRTDNDPSGGYLTPPEYFNEILKKIIEVSPVRQYSRIVKTSRESILVPVRENIVQGNWVGEGIQFPVSNSNYGIRDLKVNMLSVSSIATIQMIQDSVFNIEDQIAQDIAESFAATEGDAFINGNGVNKPEGILATAGLTGGVEAYPSGIADSFDGDSIIRIAGQLKTGYNPYYMLNRKTLATVRSLKDGIGQYLWTPGIALGYPNMINGYPYINAINVPDADTNTFPIIFGDFFRGYMIADHINLFIIRDNYTQSAQGKVVFNAIRRVGGMVVLSEAIKALKCAVS